MTNRKKTPLREIITERLNNGLDEHIRQLEVSFGDRWQDLPPLEQLQSEIRYLRVKLAAQMVATEVVLANKAFTGEERAQQLIESAIEIAGSRAKAAEATAKFNRETKKKHLPPTVMLALLKSYLRLREEGVSQPGRDKTLNRTKRLLIQQETPHSEWMRILTSYRVQKQVERFRTMSTEDMKEQVIALQQTVQGTKQ